MPTPSLDTTAHLTVRVGCRLVYEPAIPTAALLCLRVRLNEHQTLIGESLAFAGGRLASPTYTDPHGNTVNRIVLPAGRTEIIHDAIVTVSPGLDNFNHSGARAVSPENLPDEVLRYTLPSRYCDFDRLLQFAWDHFAHIEPGRARVQAISDWLHANIEYRFGSGSPDLTAWDIIQRGHGVCRDFAHMIIALCRALNMPARYVVGHLPDIGYTDPGTPMDFHAYAEVYLEGGWFTHRSALQRPAHRPRDGFPRSRRGQLRLHHQLRFGPAALLRSLGLPGSRRCREDRRSHRPLPPP